jgi:SAM-dependent methyltransferase
VVSNGPWANETLKDRFSQHASEYAAFRPNYPPALYDFILLHTTGRDVAWDCACGNGQVALDLAPHFRKVEATDISQKQLDNAFRAPNIHYSIATAEQTEFSDKTFDLITVGQAIHWFQQANFFKEVSRVGKHGATIAYWGYALFRVSPAIDKIVDEFYGNVIGPYWDPERKMIDDHYQTIDFPFERIPSPALDFSFLWTLQALEGYITTWSAVQKYIAHRAHNPVPELISALGPLWSGGECKVTFPLFVAVATI